MNKEKIEEYEGYDEVKLVLTSGFVIYGKIEAVEEETVHFVSKKAISDIEFDQIKQIIYRR